MRTLTYQLRDLKKAVICIGFEDENNRTQIRIDCGEVFSEYPNAAVTMKVQAPKGGIYPATVTRDGNMILWTVRDCDVANKGNGEFQLTFTDGTTVIKTCPGRFHVDRSLKGSGTAPSGVQDWLDNAEKVLEDLENAEVNQPKIVEGNWYVYNVETGEYVDTGVKAQGEDGDPGQPGTDATPDLITVPYSQLTFPVSAGTQCYHDGKLYQAKQDIQTSEAWTAAHWQETTVEAQLNTVKSALTSVQNDLTAYKKLDFELGTISIANGQIDKSYSNRVCCAEYIEFDSVLTVTPGNDTKVNLRFYDKNKSFLGGTSSWKTTKQTVADYKSTYQTAKYLRIACAYTDDSTISDPTVFVGKIEVKIKGNLSDLYEKVEKNTDGLSDKSFEYNNIGTLENPNSVTYRNTGYVPVNEGDVVEYRTRIRNGYTYYVFDENKTQILRGEFVTLDTEHGFITIPSGGKYIFAQTMHTNHDYYEKYTPILKILGIKTLIEGSQNLKIHNKPTGNVSIVCAKEFTFSDGTPPVNEFYLLEEPLTQQFYITHDFSDKIKAFKFVGEDSYKYTFGVLQNGDIIAVRLAETLTGTGKNDANRMNPFVFLASENWSVQHEVSFGSALKPCGWLSNTGFRVLPNGTAVFCEYTRVTTETSNVWVLSGDPLVASNWTVTKSFPITNPGDGTLFKHCHTIQYDHFTGVVYVATGDDDVGSMIWYSTDNGLTWTQLIPPNGSSEQDEHGWYMGSEKYCRLLMFTFTDDYIYWASDTPLPNRHFLFRAERNNNGVLDFDTVEDYVEIPAVSTLATYGTAYIPELNSIMLLERSDSGATSAPIRLVDLETDELVTVATMYSASGSSDNVGFRTRFSEWYPHNGFIRLGFMLRVSPSKAVNTIKGFGNTGATNDPGNNINNLTLQITKQDGDFKLTMGTIYI